MAGGAETPNIAALPAIARLGACKSARGPDADRRVKLLIQFAVDGSHSGAYSHLRLSRRAASVMASKGYVTSERSNSRLDVATRRKGCAAKSVVESGHLAAD